MIIVIIVDESVSGPRRFISRACAASAHSLASARNTVLPGIPTSTAKVKISRTDAGTGTWLRHDENVPLLAEGSEGEKDAGSARKLSLVLGEFESTKATRVTLTRKRKRWCIWISFKI